MMNWMLALLFDPSRIENILLGSAAFLAVGTVCVAALKFYFDLRGLMEDVKNYFVGKEDFQVRLTILKTIAKNDHTQRIKLQTLRVFKKLTSVEIDPIPKIVDLDDRRFVGFSDPYCIPGRVQETYENNLKVEFKPDEAPRARQDYTYVTSLMINESMQDMWGKPGIVVTKPVGRDYLVVEFFCPAGWHYKRDENGRPLIKAYTERVEGSGKEEDRDYVPQKNVFSDGGTFKFDLREGPVDWFRVTVRKPPQVGNVNVDWFWDDQTEKLFQDLEATKLAAAASTNVRGAAHLV